MTSRADKLARKRPDTLTVEVLDEHGRPVTRDAVEVADELGQALTIDQGDGSTLVIHPDGTLEAHNELPLGHPNRPVADGDR